MLKSYIIAYPWDLIDEGVDEALDRLAGEVGIGGLSLWAASPPVTQLRIREIEPRIFRSEGGLLFEPSLEHYSSTRLKPVASARAVPHGGLREICEACSARGLELRIRISAAGTGLIAGRYPDLACENLLGDRSERFVCLANSEVEAYLYALAADMADEFSPAGLVVSDFASAWIEGLTLLASALRPDDWAARALLALCFCESCRGKASSAGVDVDEVLRCARTVLQERLGGQVDEDDSLGRVLAENAALLDYYLWRAKDTSALLRRIRNAFAGELILDRNEDDVMFGFGSGLDLNIPAAVLTRIARLDGAESAIKTEALRNELRLPADCAVGSSGPQLVSMLPRAVERGISGVEFEHYGELSDAALTFVRQAIRFARRTASA